MKRGGLGRKDALGIGVRLKPRPAKTSTASRERCRRRAEGMVSTLFEVPEEELR
jgi:hypothetical protein